MSTDTTRWYSSISMAIVGYGVGMTMPTLSLAAQNAVSGRDLGVVTSATTFFRSLGGALGVALFGAVLNARTNAELDQQLPAGTLDRSRHPAQQPEGHQSAAPGAVGTSDPTPSPKASRRRSSSPCPSSSSPFGFAWFLRELPLRETGNLTTAVTPSEPGVPVTEPPLV